jgi:hypothetical protein
MTGEMHTMRFQEIDASRTRLKRIADELQRWPSPSLVEKLCCEADCGACIDPHFAPLFTAIHDVGTDLLALGGYGAVQRLPIAIELLDNAVSVKKISLCLRSSLTKP